MVRVKATREGLVGQKTASGYVICRNVPFVALPSTKVLRRAVQVRNPLNGRVVTALVLDVGPFNIDDDAYVIQPSTEKFSAFSMDGVRPKAEDNISISGKGTNGAGIDLGEFVWNALGMKDNTNVDWEFLD